MCTVTVPHELTVTESYYVKWPHLVVIWQNASLNTFLKYDIDRQA